MKWTQQQAFACQANQWEDSVRAQVEVEIFLFFTRQTKQSSVCIKKLERKKPEKRGDSLNSGPYERSPALESKAKG